MLAVSALQSAAVNDDHPTDTTFDVCTGDDNGFPDFSDANALLDGIDFDDLFLGMDDGDVLPDLEVDPELLADFSVGSAEESSDVNTSPSPEKDDDDNNNNNLSKEEEDKSSGSDGGGGEIASKRDESSGKNRNNSNNSSPKEGLEKSRKSCSSSQSKNSSHGKRKVKVDWTPELHRRFVQAVEQLGVDKAVPSRILELMGIDCLTRHNIASHLQKYRSHRKHLLAREAEAASWTQRRQMYGGGAKRADLNPWLAHRPTLGYPPMAPPQPMHPFRPLHVWGHPTPLRPQPATLAPPPPPPESPFWHHQRAPSALTPGTPCFPQALPPPMVSHRLGAPPVPGIPPHAVYKVDPGARAAGRSGPPPSHLFDIQPSKESIDAAIGDVLSKPWLPLPLGLKSPSTDSVMGELQRHGVPKVPPAATCA